MRITRPTPVLTLVLFMIATLGIFIPKTTFASCACDNGSESIEFTCDDICQEALYTGGEDTAINACDCSSTMGESRVSCASLCVSAGITASETSSPTDSSSTSTPSTTSRKLLTPVLSVDVPTVTFSDVLLSENEGKNYISVNFLGDYISGVYTYLLGISTTIAIVMLMIGGLQWALGGASAESVGKAQTRMKNAVTGLVLLLCTYLILFTVNPNLIKLQFPELETIQYVELVKDSGDASGTTSTENLEAAGIDCPGSGDVATIAKSFLGKTTYRLGAKGGPAPYSSETKIDPSGRHYSEYCPEGTVCLDCSGFVDMVAQCAGLAPKNESGGTSGIFSSALSITSCGNDSVTLSDGTTHTLTAGDLVGFKKGDWTESNSGHVWMYIGDGTLINSVGSGRVSGTSVITQSLKSACSKFPLRFVDR